MFKTQAMVHSLEARDEVTILHENGPNDVIAEYKGGLYSAVFNVFVGLYYVDNLYGGLPPGLKYCPKCGAAIQTPPR
jgi:hypothetical protein